MVMVDDMHVNYNRHYVKRRMNDENYCFHSILDYVKMLKHVNDQNRIHLMTKKNILLIDIEMFRKKTYKTEIRC